MNEIFKPTKDGYDISPPGVLLLAADTGFGAGGKDSTEKGIANARQLASDILAAARAGGYPQCDILETLLVKGEVSKRVFLMAQKACDMAGNDRLAAVFERMRERTK